MILVIINLLTSNSKPHLKCVGGGWGLNVCGGVNSALIQYCICSFPVTAPKYCISFQHSCELSLRMVLVSVDGEIYKQTEKHADRQVSPDCSTGSIKVPYGQRLKHEIFLSRVRVVKSLQLKSL